MIRALPPTVQHREFDTALHIAERTLGDDHICEEIGKLLASLVSFRVRLHGIFPAILAPSKTLLSLVLNKARESQRYTTKYCEEARKDLSSSYELHSSAQLAENSSMRLSAVLLRFVLQKLIIIDMPYPHPSGTRRQGVISVVKRDLIARTAACYPLIRSEYSLPPDDMNSHSWVNRGMVLPRPNAIGQDEDTSHSNLEALDEAIEESAWLATSRSSRMPLSVLNKARETREAQRSQADILIRYGTLSGGMRYLAVLEEEKKAAKLLFRSSTRNDWEDFETLMIERRTPYTTSPNFLAMGRSLTNDYVPHTPPLPARPLANISRSQLWRRRPLTPQITFLLLSRPSINSLAFNRVFLWHDFIRLRWPKLKRHRHRRDSSPITTTRIRYSYHTRPLLRALQLRRPQLRLRNRQSPPGPDPVLERSPYGQPQYACWYTAVRKNGQNPLYWVQFS
jgi:hypothetical protein